jgi:hypothetical protein
MVNNFFDRYNWEAFEKGGERVPKEAAMPAQKDFRAQSQCRTRATASVLPLSTLKPRKSRPFSLSLGKANRITN